MVVGEPSLMGGEFGEEDERLISRLENAQYDPAAAAAQAAATQSANPAGTLGPQGGLGGQPMGNSGPPTGPPHMGGPPQGMDSNFNTGPSGWSSSGPQGGRTSSGGTPGPGPASGPNNAGGPVGTLTGPGPGGSGNGSHMSSVNQGPNSGGSIPGPGQIVPKIEPDLNKSPSNC